MTQNTRKNREYYDTLRMGMASLQQVHIDGRDIDRALAYWIKQLAQIAPQVALCKPARAKRPANGGSDV